MAKQTVLLVDADLKSARVLEVSLRKAGYSVTLVKSAVEALEAIDIASPELVLSDTRLAPPPTPPREGSDTPVDGYQLCRRLKDDPVWYQIPFIFLTSSSSIEDKIRGLELGVEDYLTKPIYIKEILTRIQLVLAKKQREGMESRTTRASFTGLLSEMGIVDLLSTIDLGRKSGVLELEGSTKGTIYFRDGRVVDAKCGLYSGANAVYRMLVWNEGRFEIRFGPCATDDVIDMSTQGVLMEGMRRLDEWQRLQEQLPPLDTVYEVDAKELSVRLGEIPDEVNSILRAFNGRRTLLEVVDASGFDDLGALATLSKLYFEGLIFQRPTQSGTAEDEIDDGTALLPGSGDEAAAIANGDADAKSDEVLAARASIRPPPAASTIGVTIEPNVGGISTAARALESTERQNPDANSPTPVAAKDSPGADGIKEDNDEREERDVAKHRGKRNRTKREMVEETPSTGSAAQAAAATQAAPKREETADTTGARASTVQPTAAATAAAEADAAPAARERIESSGGTVIQFPKLSSASETPAQRPGKPTLPMGTLSDEARAEINVDAAESLGAEPKAAPPPAEAKKTEKKTEPEIPSAKKNSNAPPPNESAKAKASVPPPSQKKSEPPPAKAKEAPAAKSEPPKAAPKDDKNAPKRDRKISFSGELTDEAKAFFQDRSYESAYKPDHDNFEDLKPEETHDTRKNRRSMIATASLVGALVLVVGGLALHNKFVGVQPVDTLQNSTNASLSDRPITNPERPAPIENNAATPAPAAVNTAAAPTPPAAANEAPPAANVAPAPATNTEPTPPANNEAPAANAAATPTPPTAVEAPAAPAPAANTAVAPAPAVANPAPAANTAAAPPAATGPADLLAAAVRARSRGNTTAIAAYQQYVDAGGADAAALSAFSYWLANRGDLGHAAEWAARATTIDANNQLGWYVLGVSRMEGPHPDRAAGRDALRRCAALPGSHAAECRGAM